MFDVSPDIVDSIVSATSSAVQELWPIIIVVFSVVLAFYGIRQIIFIISLAKR